jgi:hypothetical protein
MYRDSEHYEDSHDMIERIRKLREAAERKMNAFGDPSEYDIRIIRGRAKDQPADSTRAAIKPDESEAAQ